MYVAIGVGCLECSEWSTVLWSEQDEQVARKRFEVEVRERYRNAQQRGNRLRPYPEDLEDAPKSLVLAAGTGGSYYYPLQLHRVPE